jgi:hypothetical protein
MSTRFKIKIFIFIMVPLVLAGMVKLMAQDKTPKQPYTVVKSFAEFEIRKYPESHLVTVDKPSDFESGRYAGFRALAGYIFGDNETEQKIAMTAPVIYHHNDSTGVSQMSFVLPQEVTPGTQPKPKNEDLYFQATPLKYYAVISRGGWPGEKALKKMEQSLLQSLEKNKITTKGNFEYRYYNPPFALFNRNTEVAIEVEW